MLKRGRPKKPASEVRQDRLFVRLNEAEWKQVQEFVQKNGWKDVTSFVRFAVLRMSK